MPILLAASVAILDQLSKLYIQNSMWPGMSIPGIKGVFHITYVLNPGAAFGILEHQRMFFILVAVGILAGVAYFYPRIPEEHRLLRIGIGLQIGGTIGNVIDRIRTGYVVDFLDFRIWPVFNIADIAIVLGIVCIMYSFIYLPCKEDGRCE